ncbi:complex I subunit 4 family protein [Parachitinimonas caeni]|uniref:NADH-quinone oxidoreductase subunit M n=1 Tax=Parachitinimonas caeni TaxID=3031301 RepID=A0ABT7DXQ2_9NEIS|nr:NADH-quinone oxidoreductase subunit M [Parachitinimonas caeni]MDK2124811.1 NADH-quinone oxidoreductase subunit M [Parachitinimonas caeni]
MLEHLLSFIIWTPIFFGVLVLAVGRDQRPATAKVISVFGAGLGFLLSLPLYFRFQDLHGGPQFVELLSWIPAFNINYHLGVDGLSMFFVVLNSFITFLVVIAGWEVITSRVSHYHAAFLVMSGLINGAFASQDAMLFYAFFEAMLIPMYLIIGVWGGPRRVYASLKFFLYTLMGSLLLLVSFIWLYKQTGSFDIATFQRFGVRDGLVAGMSLKSQTLLLVAFFFAFAVKVPMFPVHTWLPDAHVEAPTGGSMVLAAITLKLGAYGFLRFALPIVPDAVREYGSIIVVLSLIAIVYVGLIALVQTDMKKLVAYSSISHMGFVTLGTFMYVDGVPTVYGLEGALMQMISHGFVSAAMFFCIGVLYDRMHSRKIADYGGVANRMPIFAAFFLLFSMANCGLPATSGFVGEFLVIMGALKVQFWIAFAAGITLIVGAAYTLWMYKRVVFGAVGSEGVESLVDVNFREFIVLAILAVSVLGMGLLPGLFSAKLHSSVDTLIYQASQYKVGREGGEK